MTSKPATAQTAVKLTNLLLKLLLNIAFYLFVIFVIMEASKIAYSFTYQIFGQETMEQAPGRDIEIQIKKGESSLNVASKLEVNRIIKNKYSFYVKAKIMNYVIMPGTYTLNTSMTYDEIFSVITVPSAEETEKTD